MFEWGIFGWFMMVIIWIAPVALIVWAISRGRDDSDGRHGKSALDILKERYAKGEIDKEEFESKKKGIAS